MREQCNSTGFYILTERGYLEQPLNVHCKQTRSFKSVKPEIFIKVLNVWRQFSKLGCILVAIKVIGEDLKEKNVIREHMQQTLFLSQQWPPLDHIHLAFEFVLFH